MFKIILQITYTNRTKVSPGEKLTPTQVKVQPSVNWNAEAKSLYALVLTDLEGPIIEDSKFREVRHWLVVNIPGANVNAGETLVEYIGSGAPKNTGFHRYVFLVFKQSEKIDYDKPKATTKYKYLFYIKFLVNY